MKIKEVINDFENKITETTTAGAIASVANPPSTRSKKRGRRRQKLSLFGSPLKR